MLVAVPRLRVCGDVHVGWLDAQDAISSVVATTPSDARENFLFGDEESLAIVAAPPPGSIQQAYRSPLEQ